MAYHANLRRREAIETYTLAERLDPDEARWPYFLAMLWIEHAEHAPAIGALRRIDERSEHFALAQLRLGETLAKTGDATGARIALQAAERRAIASAGKTVSPSRRGGSVEAHAAFALAALDAAADQRREPPPLVDPLLDSLAERSSHPDFLLKHAALASRSDDLAWRERLAARAVEVQPRSLDTLLEMAATLQAKEEHNNALTYLGRAAAVAPDDHHVLVEQGQSLSALGRLDEAEQVLRRAVRVRDASAEYNLATVLDLRDQWPEAQRHYERALDINPYHARALNNLGIGLGRRGKPAEAAGLYRRAIAIAPADPDALTNLSGALMAMGRFEEALTTAESALKINANLADANNNRGICLAQLGRRGEAREAFLAALKIDGRHRDARNNLAILDRRP